MQILKSNFFVLFGLFLTGFSCFGQDEKKPDKPAMAATVKGRMVQNENKDFAVDFAEFNAALFQQVQLPEPPIPGNWSELSMEQRQQWIKTFEGSDRGKAFLEDRRTRIAGAAKFEIQVEKNGDFVVYDVPYGRYGLRGRHEKTIDEKNYVLEVFGQIDIGEKVEEVLLDPIMVMATRLLRAGEPLPTFEVPTFDNKAKIHNKLLVSPELKEKHVLFSFWSMDSPPSKDFTKQVQKMYSTVSAEHGLQLISICIGSDPKKALEFVKTVRVRGWHGYVENWEDELVNEFGVRVVPALFLVNPKQTVVLTHSDFRRAFQNEGADLATIVIDAITGKNIPTNSEDTKLKSNKVGE